ncbi:YjcZ family sporulation protein [Neobacillus sp. D3-1R]
MTKSKKEETHGAFYSVFALNVVLFLLLIIVGAAYC